MLYLDEHRFKLTLFSHIRTKEDLLSLLKDVPLHEAHITHSVTLRGPDEMVEPITYEPDELPLRCNSIELRYSLWQHESYQSITHSAVTEIVESGLPGVYLDLSTDTRLKRLHCEYWMSVLTNKQFEAMVARYESEVHQAHVEYARKAGRTL